MTRMQMSDTSQREHCREQSGVNLERRVFREDLRAISELQLKTSLLNIKFIVDFRILIAVAFGNQYHLVSRLEKNPGVYISM